ncbi:LuxR C-terminal-related transcriptional regulator [Streptomyces sp. NPDC089915]|uniref:response regulator transcription factor n=1 Tax=Streptomyces sp. NPDC089915 TaxID=3155186 RepID=UPI00341A772A
MFTPRQGIGPHCSCGVLTVARRASGSRPNAPATALTSRETEVLLLLGGALGNAVIARRLDITERTVKKHVTAIFEKLALTSRVEAALMAVLHHPRLCPEASEPQTLRAMGHDQEYPLPEDRTPPSADRQPPCAGHGADGHHKARRQAGVPGASVV